MFVNSLFKDFICENGLKVWKGESTRDFICLEFNYGSRSYGQEIEHLKKAARTSINEYKKAIIRNDKYLIDKALKKRAKINELLYIARKNRNIYNQLSTDELREYFYVNGVSIEYKSRTKSGEIKNVEVIRYKMLYRSTGKAKKGSCMFIRDRLYNKSINFLRMGIKPDKSNSMIVELSAYAPLVSSGIVGKIKINPKNILILKDVDRFFETNVVSVETDENNHCVARRIENYKLKNTLFDGQALIDSSIFPSWGNGYILLRHHFCKMAAFNANIQKFFKDYFGKAYNTATVTDMFGNNHYVKDIELITTDNAMKWLKFGKSYDYWCKWVYDNNCMFGIVKTAHRSKLGNMQRMSYQMVNSLSEEIMPEVVKESVQYINRLKTDTEFFIEYLRKNENFSNDYEVLVALYEHNPDFERSSYFRERRSRIIKSYVMRFKSGQVLQNADNLTIVGSPYAMLLYAATGNESSVDDDDTFFQEDGTIQCYTERFNSGEYLAGFRSPFNGKYNLSYMHNVYHQKFEKYFNFGKNVLAVNVIGTDWQDRNNGADQDSDFQYVTNQKDIVAHAKYCYENYNTIVNNISKDSNKYGNTLKDFALVDNLLSASQTDIGESSNLAQIAQTYTCNFDDQKYEDYVCILSVIAQIAIDSAKRRFCIDTTEEIKRIRNDMDIKSNKYPEFWRIIKHGFDNKNINKSLRCPMNYLAELEIERSVYCTKTMPMDNYFIKHGFPPNYNTCKKVEEFISEFIIKIIDYNANEEDVDHLLLRSDYDVMIQRLQMLNISGKYVGLFSWLIDRAFLITGKMKSNSASVEKTLQKNRPLLLKTLYDVNQKCFLECFCEKNGQKRAKMV